MKKGEVKISGEVVASIAGLAATEVIGVKELDGGLLHDMITRSDGSDLSKGIHILFGDDQEIFIRVNVVVDGIVPIPEINKGVQEKVKSAVESMTGMLVKEVDVVITGVKL